MAWCTPVVFTDPYLLLQKIVSYIFKYVCKYKLSITVVIQKIITLYDNYLATRFCKKCAVNIEVLIIKLNDFRWVKIFFELESN